MNSLKSKAILLFVGILCSFNLIAHVNLNSPVGGEVFSPGQYVKIEWEIAIEHNTENWDLYFSIDGGKNYEAINLDMDVQILSFDWPVPYKPTKNARIKIVQDNIEGDYIDESNDFTIEGFVTASTASLEDFEVQLFPNPASDHVNLNISQTSAQIEKMVMTDIIGRSVNLPIFFREEDENELYLDISKYTPGIYYLIFFMGEGTEVRKLVIQ